MEGEFGLCRFFRSVCPWFSKNDESKKGFPVALWTNKLCLYNRPLYKRLLCLEASGLLNRDEVVEKRLARLYYTLYIIAEYYSNTSHMNIRACNFLSAVLYWLLTSYCLLKKHI